jgi:hypothetical protein
MTRKDYKLLAAVLKEYVDADKLAKQNHKTDRNHAITSDLMNYRLRGIVDSISYALQQDNPRFDRLEFIRACGI